MKYLPLIWAGIWRKRSRAVLMLLQIVSAFVLFGALQAVDTGVNRAIAKANPDVLYVNSSVSGDVPLPISMLARIRSVPGVKYVSEYAGFGGTYQKPDQYVPVVTGDIDAFVKIYSENEFSPSAIRGLKSDRTGAIVGIGLMRKYGWKIGDHIVLVSGLPKTDGSHDWGFDIVGEFDVPDKPENTNLIVANFAYLNESRLTGRDHTSTFVAKVNNPANADTVALAIDNAFANSGHETRTQSEAEVMEASLERLGDLDFIVHGIITAVFFALLLATGALMMQSLRERTPELAVLKTVGFTDRRVMALILTESVSFCISAAAIGLGLSIFLLPLARRVMGDTRMSWVVLAQGAACAVALALIGAWIPARRGSRLQVVDAVADR